MSGLKKIVVFDFDKTLTCNDTLFGFFTEFKSRGLIVKKAAYLFCQVLAKIGFISNSVLKDVGLKLFIDEASDLEINEKSLSYSKKICFSDLKSQLDQDTDFIAIVVTASFECYVRHCFNENILVIGSTIERTGGRVKLRNNCFGEVKVERLKLNGIQRIDKFYTDSESDLPVAAISNVVYFVKSGSVVKIKG